MLSSDLFASAFEKGRAGLLLLETATGLILEVNAAFLRICGRQRREILGHVFWRTPLAADDSAGGEIFERLRAVGSVEGAEYPSRPATETVSCWTSAVHL